MNFKNGEKLIKTAKSLDELFNSMKLYSLLSYIEKQISFYINSNYYIDVNHIKKFCLKYNLILKNCNNYLDVLFAVKNYKNDILRYHLKEISKDIFEKKVKELYGI